MGSRAQRRRAGVAAVLCVALGAVPRGEAAPLRKLDVKFRAVRGAALALDAFVPDGKGPFPAVVVVHGGDFTGGDKRRDVQPFLDVLGAAGFACFAVNYRLAPRWKFPAAVEDVEAAVAWVRARARSLRVDPARIAVLGEAAGGYLASMVGARGQVEVAAVVAFHAPHDFGDRLEMGGKIPAKGPLPEFFGAEKADLETVQRLRASSPVNLVRKDMPPYLLVHSIEDPVVPFNQSLKMCDRMRRAGATCALFTLQSAGHGVETWAKEAAERARLLEWLSARLGAAAPAPQGAGPPRDVAPAAPP